MNIEQYYLKAVCSDAIYLRHWFISLLTITQDTKTVEDYPYRIKRHADDVRFLNPETGEWEVLVGAEPDKPLFDRRDPIRLPAGVLENAPNGIKETTYGNIYVNKLIFCIPLGTAIPYQEGYITLDEAHTYIADNFVDDPEEGQPVPEGKVSASMYMLFGKCTYQLSAVLDTIAHYTTPKSMMAHPGAIALREELMEKFKGQLNDPVIIAQIGDALEKLDREWLANDPILDFYTKSKYFGKIRKKLYYMFGGEPGGFDKDGKIEFVPQSLAEGIDVKHLPAMINSARYGSFSRGHLTQLGGRDAKTGSRATGGIIIESGADCGVKIGRIVAVTKQNVHDQLGRYRIVNGKPVATIQSDLDGLIGKVIEVRSPLYCKQGGPEGKNYCAICSGDGLASAPEELGMSVSAVSSRINGIFMSLVHGMELKTVEYSLDDCLS